MPLAGSFISHFVNILIDNKNSAFLDADSFIIVLQCYLDKKTHIRDLHAY